MFRQVVYSLVPLDGHLNNHSLILYFLYIDTIIPCWVYINNPKRQSINYNHISTKSKNKILNYRRKMCFFLQYLSCFTTISVREIRCHFFLFFSVCRFRYFSLSRLMWLRLLYQMSLICLIPLCVCPLSKNSYTLLIHQLHI